MMTSRTVILVGIAGIVLGVQGARAAQSTGTENATGEVREAYERKLSVVTSVDASIRRISTTGAQRRRAIDELFARMRQQFDEPAVPALAGRALPQAAPILAERPASPPAPVHVTVPPSISPRETFAPTLSEQAAAAPEREPTYHTIAAGETLISVSRQYYGSASYWKMLASVNEIADTASIRVGQSLFVPANPERPERPAERTIPLTAKLPVERVNRVTAPSEQPLDYTKYEWKVYNVKPGDTLSSLAQRYYGEREKASVLAQYNQMRPETSLVAGSNILVPLPKSPEISQRYLLSTQGIFR